MVEKAAQTTVLITIERERLTWEMARIAVAFDVHDLGLKNS